MALKIGYQALVNQAEGEVESILPEEAMAQLNNEEVLFVDVRDVRELRREGKVPGAFHAPRGMLEFWVDPESPYFKDVFAENRRLIIYCNKGWRSALATKTLKDMGLNTLCHIAGGFGAWVQAGGPVEKTEPPAES